MLSTPSESGIRLCPAQMSNDFIPVSNTHSLKGKIWHRFNNKYQVEYNKYLKGVGTKYRVILEKAGPSGLQEKMNEGSMKKRHVDGWIRFE